MELKFQGDKMDRRKRANRNRIIRNDFTININNIWSKFRSFK